MTAGASGSYAINGVEILQPTSGRWLSRDRLGIDGNGHVIYPGVREFEMKFVLSSPSDYNQILGYYNAVSNTGTVVIDLPQFGAASYVFYSYSGCVLQEPEVGTYFSTYHNDVTLLVTKIRT